MLLLAEGSFFFFDGVKLKKQQVWLAKMQDHLSHLPASAVAFSGQLLPRLAVRGISDCFLFLSWDETFHKRGSRQIGELLQRLEVKVAEVSSFHFG